MRSKKKLNSMNNLIIIICKYFSGVFFGFRFFFRLVSSDFQHQAQQQPQLATLFLFFCMIPIDRYRYNAIDLSIHACSSVLCKKFKNFAYFSVRRLNISRICSNCTIYSDYRVVWDFVGGKTSSHCTSTCYGSSSGSRSSNNNSIGSMCFGSSSSSIGSTIC